LFARLLACLPSLLMVALLAYWMFVLKFQREFCLQTYVLPKGGEIVCFKIICHQTSTHHENGNRNQATRFNVMNTLTIVCSWWSLATIEETFDFRAFNCIH